MGRVSRACVTGCLARRRWVADASFRRTGHAGPLVSAGAPKSRPFHASGTIVRIYSDKRQMRAGSQSRTIPKRMAATLTY
jgi:hypothetical protein